MAEYVTHITVGNKPDALKNYLSEKFGVTTGQAEAVLADDPYQPKSREDQYRWIERVVAKIKSIREATS
jgi:hypothetical protein